MEHIVGIDLGTRFSCVSVWRNKRFEIIPDQFGNRTVPSVVSFYKSARLVGNNALAMKEIDPANTIYDVKRIIGRRITDEHIELTKQLITYKLSDDGSDHHNILIDTDNKQYRPEEIASYILSHLKNIASDYLKQPVEKVVLTVPAYFNDSQRQATLDAAHIAGLDVIKMINEPTAAALAYGMGSVENQNVLIYDFGAGTLDVSLMNIDNGVFRTLSVSGNNHLGGEDIDYLLMNKIINIFKSKHKIIDLVVSSLSKVKLKNAVENAKKILSSNSKTIVCVEGFHNGLDLIHPIDRKFLESTCNELFIMCMKPIIDVLDNSGLNRSDVDAVVLVGGSTRIPKIRKLILELFKGTKIQALTHSLNPDEAVSAGASIYGYIMSHKSDPFSENLVLLDITPLSLGIETLQKQMTNIIPRSTVIPSRKTKIFSTDTDDQTCVSIKIFEGERKLTKDNFHIGTFDLTGFEKGPRGYPTIKITFHVDIHGILQVSAFEKKSAVENSIRISSTWGAKGRMSKVEIDKIIDEAKKYDFIDTVYSLKIGLTHQIRAMCETIRHNLKDNTLELTNSDKKRIRSYVRKTLKKLDSPLEDLHIDELKDVKKRMAKNYCLLVTRFDEGTSNLKGMSEVTNVTEIHGDDEDQDTLSRFNQQLDIPTDGDSNSIKNLKKVVSDLCKNILQIVNNPVTQFTNKDKTFIKDYIDSVLIWLYISSSTNSIDYVTKIDEVNKMMEKIMESYPNNLFTPNNSFTSKDELLLTCNTLRSAIKSNFFSIHKTELSSLDKIIDENLLWLENNPDMKQTEYQIRIEHINGMCNQYYHSMTRLDHIEEVIESDSDEEEDDEDLSTGIKISEKLDDMIASLPDKPVLLQLDPQKLAPKLKINYRK